MSKREDRGLATSAGLVRYMDESLSKIRIEPEKVIGITLFIIIAEIILTYGMFL
jgi:preprotein translocase subunit Sec61beta